MLHFFPNNDATCTVTLTARWKWEKSGKRHSTFSPSLNDILVHQWHFFQSNQIESFVNRPADLGGGGGDCHQWSIGQLLPDNRRAVWQCLAEIYILLQVLADCRPIIGINGQWSPDFQLMTIYQRIISKQHFACLSVDDCMTVGWSYALVSIIHVLFTIGYKTRYKHTSSLFSEVISVPEALLYSKTDLFFFAVKALFSLTDLPPPSIIEKQSIIYLPCTCIVLYCTFLYINCNDT